MGSEWSSLTVGELADSVSETHPFNKEHLIFLNTSDILRGEFLHRTYSPVRDFPGQAKKSIKKNDILFSEIRPANGRYAYVNIQSDDYVVSTKLMVIRAREFVLPRYLYHFLTSEQSMRLLQHLAESRSGTFPQITFEQVSSLLIALPSKAEQEGIIAFIDTLDTKIESNRRMNATLEEMARTLFQSWFVDFDPVQAKAEGRKPYGMDDKISVLFPDSFEISPMGEMPRGWTYSTIGSVCKIASGKRPSTRNPRSTSETQVPLWGSNGKIGFTNNSLYDRPILLTGRVGTLGSVFRVNPPSYPSDNTLAVIPNAKSLFILLYFRLKQLDYASLNRGSTQPLLTQADLKSQSLILPCGEVLDRFSAIVSPIMEYIDRLENESKTLASTRDALLPKLLSGEIRVSDAEDQIEEAI